MAYTLGSLFDGSGGFPLAATLCGMEPKWAAEIEPYPIAVTRSRFPDMQHLGSVTEVHGGEIEPVDVITFGSPCQDLSVAGKRKGLKHTENGDDETTRSGLFMEAVRIIKEMRDATNGKQPRFALWENVPGAFSSNRGEDFRIVLEELIKVAEPQALELPPPGKDGWPYADCIMGDGWSLAWRVFDAQYWGVPQRRRRIHLVADFAGQCAGEVLFEREGVRGYFAQGGTTWQGVATHPQEGPGAADREGVLGHPVRRQTVIIDSIGWQAEKGWEGEVSPCLKASHYKFPPTIAYASGFCTEHSAKAGGIGYQEEVAPTLRAGVTPACMVATYDARGNGDGETVSTLTGYHENRITDYSSVVCEPVVFDGANVTSPVNAANPQPGDPCHTLSTDSRNYAVYCLQGNAIDRADTAGCNGKGWKEGTSYTLNTIDRPAVAYATDVGFFSSLEEQSPTLLARGYKDPHLVAYPDGGIRYIVRRLTPTECARLQGFPDWWGHPDHKGSFTEEELAFWQGVRDVYAEINGKQVKVYTAQQMLKWYNGLHTDSAEYKMWGNGIALPPALYVMQGICIALEMGDLL